jgi:hypothetical protein
MGISPSGLRTTSAFLALQVSVALAAAKGVSTKILVLARDDYTATQATSGLQAYGIPYEKVVVPKAGVVLPTLNSTASDGNYGGIILVNEVAYSYDSGWGSAITAEQWQQIYDYQTAFAVRLVRIDAYPSSKFGKFSSRVARC